jgi:GDPmannose 4,6-dehydratase
MSRRALITGIGGQDGSYLAELLLEKGYEVWGVVRSQPSAPGANLQAIAGRLTLVQADLADPAALPAVLDRSRPDEVYNLASASFVPRSWEDPLGTVCVNALAVTALLEAVRRGHPDTRVLQAGSSEIFGPARESPQNEDTPLGAVTPYGIAKAHAHLSVAAYRSRHGLHASSGIAFNHESPRRPPAVVTRKVTRAAAAIQLGLQSELALGDLDATRDWGFAGDYVEAMWLMLQQPEPGDYVLATGVGRTVRELVDVAFARVGIDPAEHIRVDDALVRPRVGAPVVGDPARARAALGWRPRVSFEAMIGEMVDRDLREYGTGAEARSDEESARAESAPSGRAG